MTTDELAKYYSSLLIIQYLQKAKAVATIKAQVTPVFMDQLPVAIQEAFNLEDAGGVQLDVLGKYVGASRIGNTLNGLVTLGDDDFRTLIKLVIITNNAGSSLATIETLLATTFPGQILIADSQAMSLDYVLIESLGTSDLLEILASGGYLPAPMGVETSITIVPAHTYPFFGFSTYTGVDPTVAGFNSYPFYSTTCPWLRY